MGRANRDFQQGEGPSRSLFNDCENFAKVRSSSNNESQDDAGSAAGEQGWGRGHGAGDGPPRHLRAPAAGLGRLQVRRQQHRRGRERRGRAGGQGRARRGGQQ